MCRLLGIVNQGKIETEIFSNFKQQCLSGCVKSTADPGHSDGWGMAYESDGQIIIKKSGQSAAADSEFDNITSKALTSQLIIAHIRKASNPKTKGKIEFAHPFQKGDWVLAHNGTVFWRKEIAQNYPNLIDSQILLEKLSENIQKEKQVLAGVEKTIREILEKEKISALNFLLTNRDDLIIFRYFDPEDKENDKYYTLFYKRLPDKVLVASEPVDSERENWRLLENSELVMVDQNLNIQNKVLRTEKIKVR